jgi:hypothetical protein
MSKAINIGGIKKIDTLIDRGPDSSYRIRIFDFPPTVTTQWTATESNTRDLHPNFRKTCVFHFELNS